MAGAFDSISLNNESDVEQKFIYPLLITTLPDGLGYAPSDIATKIDIRKISIDKGGKKKLYYPDYAIILDGVPGLIIEAKAPGVDLSEALREARLYATEINAAYPSNINPCQRLLVTDGDRVIGCYWDDESPHIEIRRADINSMDPVFAELQKFASKRAIQSVADALLRKLRTSASYVKPVQMLGGKSVANESVGDNSFGANVSIEYKYLFNPESADERASVVHNAYVTSKRKQAHVAPIDKIIRAAMPFHMIEARHISDSGAPSELLEKLSDIRRVQNELCLLIGSVGSGKSTFTDYLRLEALPRDIAASTGWINVNLNVAPLSREKIYDWIVRELTNSIAAAHPEMDFDELQFLRKIYSREIGRAEKGKAALYERGSQKHIEIIFGEIERLQLDSVATLDALVNYLYGNANKLLVVVLDNCDKRSRDDQLLMFEVASWLKLQFKCMVFLPLRDTTYDQYRNEPPLDTVIKDLVFRIDPPLLEQVIYTRLNYAIREIGGNRKKFVYNLSNGIKVECARSEVGDYLKSIIASLFQDQFFKRMITGLAGRNIRRGLEILLDFCKSGHIGEGEILKSRQSNGEHKLPSHLVAKILLKGKRRYYSDEDSNIKNLFDSAEDDALPNPFTRIAILHWLRNHKRLFGPNRTLGYHKVNGLLADLQAAGFAAERVMAEVSLLHTAECINAEAQGRDIDGNDLVTISPAGLVHLDLLRNINYLSTVAEDVLFRENQPAKKIADNLVGKSEFKVDSRQAAISNSKTLVEYLTAYHQKFFLGDAKVIADENIVDLIGLSDISTYVMNIVQNDPIFRDISSYEKDYPSGTQVDGQVVSAQVYGIFVEFGISGSGLVHKTQMNGLNSNPSNALEAGDWVIVEVIKYSSEHRRFDLKLIDR